MKNHAVVRRKKVRKKNSMSLSFFYLANKNYELFLLSSSSSQFSFAKQEFSSSDFWFDCSIIIASTTWQQQQRKWEMENSNTFSPTHTIALPHRWRVSTLNYVNMWFDHGEKKGNSRKFENFPIPTQFPAHTSCERQQWQSNVSEEIKIMMEILERFRSDKTQERETTSYGESSVSVVGV